MARRYPTYDDSVRFTPRIVTPRAYDPSGEQVAASSARNLAASADRVMRFAMSRGKESAVSAGAAAGGANPQGVLQQHKGKRPTSSYYEQAAWDAAVRVSGATIETEARTAMQSAWLDAIQNKTDSQTLKTRLDEIRLGYTDSLSVLDPLIAAKINGNLERVSQSLFISNSGHEIKRAEAEHAAQGMQLFNSTVYQVELDGRSGVSDKNFEETLGRFTTSMEGFGLTGTKQFSTMIQKLTTAHHRARVRGEFQRAVEKGDKAANKYIQDFNADLSKGKGHARGLYEAGKKVLGSEMLTWLKAENAQVKRKNTAKTAVVRAAVDDAHNAVKDLHPVGNSQELINQAIATGDSKILAKAQMTEQLNDLRILYNDRSPAIIEAAIDEYTAKFYEDADLDPSEKAKLDILLKIKKRNENGLKNNPVELYNKLNPTNPLAQIAGTDVFDYGALQGRIQKIDQFYYQMGQKPTSPKYLSGQEVDLIANYIETSIARGSAEEVISALTMLAEGAGPKIKPLLMQLSKDYGSFAQLAGIAANPDNPNLDTNFLTQVFRGYQLYESKDANPPKYYVDKNILNPKIMEFIGAGEGVLSPDHIERIQEVVKFRYAAHLAENDTTPSRSDYKKWVHLALGGHIDDKKHYYGGIVEWEGSHIVIPNSIAHDTGLLRTEGFPTLDDIMENITPTKEFLPNGMPHYVDEKGKMRPFSLDELRTDIKIKMSPRWTEGIYYLTNKAGEVLLNASANKPATINLKASFGTSVNDTDVWHTSEVGDE
jgi:hypothetical protein